MLVAVVLGLGAAPQAEAQQTAQEQTAQEQTAQEAAPAQEAPLEAATPGAEARADTTGTAAQADQEAERRLLSAQDDAPQGLRLGLVIDETITTIGRDFYAVFYDAWEAPPGAVNYTVTVGEQPTIGRGTRVTVRVNDQIAFDTRLQPGYDRIEQAALVAVSYTQRALASAAPLSRGL